ncbi:MAG: hypothetical protein HY286_15020 [Planctomycetes bacterium]|nr:hypothetical protein [Planctomycetota bacterium]
MSGIFNLIKTPLFRVGGALVVVAALAGVPVWSSLHLSKLRSHLNERAASLMAEMDAVCEISHAGRDGEMASLDATIRDFDIKIPFGAQTTHLKYLLEREARECGVRIVTLTIGEPEPVLFGESEPAFRLSISIEAAGASGDMGRFLDRIPAMPRLVAVHSIKANAERATATENAENTKDASSRPGGARTSENYHCQLKASAYFRQPPAAELRK